MRRVWIVMMLLGVVGYGAPLRVAVAANVSYAIEPLIEAFHKSYPHTKVEVVLGSSGKLTAQIRHGAPYDLFLSANMRYPEALYKEGLSVTKPVVYAKGSLALLSMKPRDFSQGLALLTQPAIHKIAIANPHTAPYGVAAAEALRHQHLYDRLKPKFVYGESVGQTLTYAMHAADVGLVAKSALFSPKLRHLKEGESWQEVEGRFYHPILQGMVRLRRTKQKRERDAFYHFMLGERAQEVLLSYGYSL